MVCDQKHKKQYPPCGSGAIWFIKGIQTSCSLWSKTVQCSTDPRQTANQLTVESQTANTSKSATSKRDFLLPVEASNHTECLSAQTPNEEAAVDCRNRRTGWWVVGGLIWGQSIDLPSLYLPPVATLKSMGKPIVPRPSVD